MSEPRARKLTAMGVANLVSTGRPEVLDRLSTEICNLWLDVFGEIKEAQDNSGTGYVLHGPINPCRNAHAPRYYSAPLTLYWDKPFEDVYTDTEGTLEHERRKAVSYYTFIFLNSSTEDTLLQAFENDPVRTTPLTGFIAARMHEAELVCGGGTELQTRYLAKADPLLLKQIGDALNGTLP